MDSGLFDLEDDQGPQNPPVADSPMTPLQRQTIRDLFARLNVTDARKQFEIVEELTGTRIASVTQLTVSSANVLIRLLAGRAELTGQTRTGRSWDDRGEDTWIDRL